MNQCKSIEESPPLFVIWGGRKVRVVYWAWPYFEKLGILFIQFDFAMRINDPQILTQTQPEKTNFNCFRSFTTRLQENCLGLTLFATIFNTITSLYIQQEEVSKCWKHSSNFRANILPFLFIFMTKKNCICIWKDISDIFLPVLCIKI